MIYGAAEFGKWSFEWMNEWIEPTWRWQVYLWFLFGLASTTEMRHMCNWTKLYLCCCCCIFNECISFDCVSVKCYKVKAIELVPNDDKWQCSKQLSGKAINFLNLSAIRSSGGRSVRWKIGPYTCFEQMYSFRIMCRNKKNSELNTGTDNEIRRCIGLWNIGRQFNQAYINQFLRSLPLHKAFVFLINIWMLKTNSTEKHTHTYATNWLNNLMKVRKFVRIQWPPTKQNAHTIQMQMQNTHRTFYAKIARKQAVNKGKLTAVQIIYNEWTALLLIKLSAHILCLSICMHANWIALRIFHIDFRLQQQPGMVLQMLIVISINSICSHCVTFADLAKVFFLLSGVSPILLLNYM